MNGGLVCKPAAIEMVGVGFLSAQIQLLCIHMALHMHAVIPAKAGIPRRRPWIPAFARMTELSALVLLQERHKFRVENFRRLELRYVSDVGNELELRSGN